MGVGGVRIQLCLWLSENNFRISLSFVFNDDLFRQISRIFFESVSNINHFILFYLCSLNLIHMSKLFFSFKLGVCDWWYNFYLAPFKFSACCHLIRWKEVGSNIDPRNVENWISEHYRFSFNAILEFFPQIAILDMKMYLIRLLSRLLSFGAYKSLVIMSPFFSPTPQLSVRRDDSRPC